MANIYNYLKNAWQRVKKEIQNNPFLILILLVLITIPLPYKYNSYTIILLTVVALFKFKSHNFHIQKEHILLMGTYLLMIISLLWSIEFKTSLKALTKEVSFVLMPIIFAIIPDITFEQRKKLYYWFSIGFSLYGVFYLIKAFYRYLNTGNKDVFFYHELVTFDVNAIHMSVFMTVAFFGILIKTQKKVFDHLALLIIFVTIILLSSKNIIVLFLILLMVYFIFINKIKITKSKVILTSLVVILSGFLFYGKLKDRFRVEFKSNTSEGVINDEISSQKGLVYNVSIIDAWSRPNFTPSDYFPGTALRVYQARIFFEMMNEDNAYLTGYGLNASDAKIAEKRIQHNLHEGYEKFNFHNQYLQFFSELGIIGFILLIIILSLNLKIAIKSKDFVHFSFAVLMISLFLTESFLVRQRGIVFFTLMFCLCNMRQKTV